MTTARSTESAAATPTARSRISYESVELLKDKAMRWRGLRRLRESAAFADNTDQAIAAGCAPRQAR